MSKKFLHVLCKQHNVIPHLDPHCPISPHLDNASGWGILMVYIRTVYILSIHYMLCSKNP